MNISNIPRKYLLGTILIAVLVLVTVTAINPGSLIFKDTTDYEAQKKIAEQEAQYYEDLLASVSPDYEASQQLLKKIATEDIVREEVEVAMDVNQKVAVRTIPNSEIKISPRNDAPTVVEYMNAVGSMISNYNDAAESAAANVFDANADVSTIASASNKTGELIANIRGLPVPESAVEFHKSKILAYEKYADFLGVATAYAQGTETNPWPKVYGDYSAINSKLDTARSEFTKLSQKYAFDLSPQVDHSGLAFVKTAQAGWPVIDVWNVAWEGIKIGLASSFANFSIVMLDKLVAHIEKNFAIASQLYYSNELGRYYSVEYMKKFVSDPLDQDIIQKFLPQYFCVSPTKKELNQIFTAKARANQGTDIVLDPNDPQFLTKLARLGGDEKNYANWWEDYYTALAAQTKVEAESAATKEVTSPGNKSGRDIISGQINKTMASIFNVQEAAINNALGLGTSNADNPVSQVVAGVVQSLVNKFVFTPISGGSSSAGGIGVLVERDVCLSNPLIKPVTPLPESEYSGVPSTPPIVPVTPLPGTTPR